MSKRPTIADLAKRSGVSRGTVDRVLNNRSYVRADVRERVLRAVQETGYLSPREAHRQASALQSQSTYPPIRLGVLLPNWTGTFRTEVMRGIEEARRVLSNKQVDIRVCSCETDTPREAIELLDCLTDWGAKGIALCALNDIMIETKINDLAAQGIPCITLNSDLPESKRLCFVGQDYAKSGRIAAELMSKCVAPNAQILAVVGNLDYHGHRTRLDGFCSHMRKLGFSSNQIEVLESYNDYRVTYNKISAALRDRPTVSAIYMANRSVTGCIDAIHAAKKTGQIRVIAHDMSEHTRQMLQEGTLDLTITQDMFRQGYQPLILLCDLLHKGQAPNADQLSTSISIVCSQNLD